MRPKLKPLSQQVIVITGASSGIGLATAERACKAGASVVLVSRNEEALSEVCRRLEREGGTAVYCVADVGDPEQVSGIVDFTLGRFGGFDTWINDAGIGVYAKLEEITREDHERLFQTNYWGVVYGSLEAVKHLKTKPGGGALINIGSIASEMPAPMLSAYAATKHAVKGFTDSLRMELIDEGAPISVTLIKPSGINTPFGPHAKNYMDVESQVPPPVYSPYVVADAILHAAEHPIRMITVGGAGRMMTAMMQLAPNLSDRLLTPVFMKMSRNEKKPRQDSDNLHGPGRDGEVMGDQTTFMLRNSLYTASQKHKAVTVGLAVLGVAALGVFLANRSGRLPLGRLAMGGAAIAALTGGGKHRRRSLMSHVPFAPRKRVSAPVRWAAPAAKLVAPVIAAQAVARDRAVRGTKTLIGR